jgi:hypothetical protein
MRSAIRKKVFDIPENREKKCLNYSKIQKTLFDTSNYFLKVQRYVVCLMHKLHVKLHKPRKLCIIKLEMLDCYSKYYVIYHTFLNK